MRRVVLSLSVILLVIVNVQGQQQVFDHVNLISLDGKRVTSLEEQQAYDPVVVIFWNETAVSSLSELDEWLESCQGLSMASEARVIVIYVDTEGRSQHLRAKLDGYSPEIEVYRDQNGEFSREMGVADLPYAMLVNGKSEVIARYSGHFEWTHKMFESELIALNNKAAASGGSR